ncbi:uncharacterized protein LOC141909839 [Tubulanus polymorphus]|uniref:uncharacterized protein LOC141909839 n=1 Tax=Tubulanus polymorphus TaxID=672921 RepID=UPI003DA5064F
MNGLKYSDAFRSLRLHHSEATFAEKRLCEAVRAVRQTASDVLETTDNDRRRGLRLLSVGSAHGYLLEDVVTELGDEVSFERMDCIEPNDAMARELETRMNTLASKYNFESEVYKREFSSEAAPSFLPNDFYDLIVFSHVLYYFDDPGDVLEVSLYKLANARGRVFVTATNNTAFWNVLRGLRALAGDGPFMPQNLVDLDELLRTKAAKMTAVSRSIDEGALMMHLALQPARSCISAHDAAIRKMGDAIVTFIAGRDIDTLLEKSRAQIQDIIRKHVVYSYGFPMLPATLENVLLARNA